MFLISGTMIERVRRGARALAIAALSLTSGCAGFFVSPGSTGSGSSTATGDYVYVANQTTGTLAGFAVGTGTLTAIASPVSLGFTPTAVAVNPANTILFVGSNAAIYAFAIGSGGALSVLNNGSAVGLSEVQSMDISPDGQWLIALDQNNVTLDEFQITSSPGVLTLETPTTYSISGTTPVPRAVKFAPNGAYLFVALGTAGDLVYGFTTSNGALSTPLTLAEISGTSDNALAVNASSTYLYIARSGSPGGLAVYAIGSGGSLSELSGSPFAAGTQPFSVVVNKGGNDVYVANQLDGTISGYSIASSGSLTPLSGSPYTNGSTVTALAVDNSGDYLLAAASGGTPDLTMYSFDPATAGKLDFSTSSATGTDPTSPIALAATH